MDADAVVTLAREGVKLAILIGTPILLTGVLRSSLRSRLWLLFLRRFFLGYLGNL